MPLLRATPDEWCSWVSARPGALRMAPSALPMHCCTWLACSEPAPTCEVVWRGAV